jgi:DNA polymerase
VARYAVVPDFETESACDLKVCGAARYAEDPTTDVLCLSCQRADGGPVYTWRPDRDGRACPPWLLAWIEDPDCIFIPHNAGFERMIWRYLMVVVYGWPVLPISKWEDSMASCAMRVLPLKLEQVNRVLRLPEQKDTEGSKITREWSKTKTRGKQKGYYGDNRTPEKLDRIVAYNIQDIHAQVNLHNRVGWLTPGERFVWMLNQKVNDRGLGLDTEFIAAAESVVAQATIPLAKEFEELTGGLHFTQGEKLKAWLHDRGVHLPNLAKETVNEVLGIDEDETLAGGDDAVSDYHLPEDAERALRIRALVGSSSIKKLPRMRACINNDGRARGLLQYHGTGPGRETGRLFQPQNFPRGSIKVDGAPPDPDAVVAAIKQQDPELIGMMFGPPVETVVSSLRHAIIAGKGRQFVSGDYSGIQARTVLALAGQFDKCDLLATPGYNPYIDMAQQIYGRPVDKHNDIAEYTIGKNSVLGLGFQMGDGKFHGKYAKTQPREFAAHVVKTYRKEWAPCVPELWQGLQDAALETVWTGLPHEAYGVEYRLEDAWLTARLPSGRRLWYFNPQKCRRHMPWSTADEPDIRRSWTYQAMKMGKWTTIDAFGGQLTENVVMGIERDIAVAAAFKLEKNGFPMVLEVHDEIVVEPLSQDADQAAVEQIMEDVPEWARALRIPIKVEGWTGDRYRK